MTNQDICSESSVSGDGETRTLTPLLAPDPKSGVSTFHHTPHKSRIYSSQRDQGNPGEKLARSAIAAHPLPLSTTWLMGCGRRGTRTPEPEWERIVECGRFELPLKNLTFQPTFQRFVTVYSVITVRCNCHYAILPKNYLLIFSKYSSSILLM